MFRVWRQCARGGCAYSQLGFGVHPPTPLNEGFLALCFPLAALQKMCGQNELRWITEVLAACAGRSTKSRETNRVRLKRAETDVGGTWRGRPLGPAQKAPGPWTLPAWGPRPWGYPQTPNHAKVLLGVQGFRA